MHALKTGIVLIVAIATVAIANYHSNSEEAINYQINLHLSCYYQYLSLAAYYERDSVALSGFSKLYKFLAEEDDKLAHKLIDFQRRRGGKVVLNAIETPSKQEWATPLSSVQFALKMEKNVNQSLHETHDISNELNDIHLRYYLEEDFIPEQVDVIHKLAKYISNLKLVGDGLGVYIFDKDLQQRYQNPKEEAFALSEHHQVEANHQNYQQRPTHHRRGSYSQGNH